MSDNVDKVDTTEAEKKEQKITLICPKHGDVTPTALFMSFKDEEDSTKTKQYLYCLPCLNEILLSLQKEGAIKTLQVKVDDGTIPEEVAKEATEEEKTAEAVKKILKPSV